MSRCPLCNCETSKGHACSVVPALPLMVDHQGLGVRVTVAPLPKTDEVPDGSVVIPVIGRVRRKG